MPKHSSKRRDASTLAFDIVAQATGEDQPKKKPDEPEKNPAAVALGRLGGLKGGIRRASVLTKEEKTKIAKMAAAARWSRKKK